MDSVDSVFVLDADLMGTLSAEGGVSLLYPSKHLAGVQCSLRGSNTPQANYEFAAFTRLLKEHLVGLRRIELRSHRYKQWALTNRRQSHKDHEPSS